MFDHCEACKKEIVPEDTVVSCEGLCENQGQFHARCVGLSYDEGCACLHRNIFWMCDSCRDLIERSRFRKEFGEKQKRAYTTKSEFDDLKSEVSKINEMVSQMMSNSAAVPSTSHVYQHADRFTAESPLSSTKLNASDRAAHSQTDACLQLYVTNIAPDVSDEEVKQMVCESLGDESVLNVKCLVPAWKDHSTLDFVSFKVTVDARHRDSALRIRNWPSGVRCREFRDFSETVWRPATRITQLST